MRPVTRRGMIGGLALAGIAPRMTLAGPAPLRLVTTELILTETALALGLSPQAAGNLPLYRRLVAAPPLPAGISDLGPLNEPNLELLAHLAPDLILAADWQRGPQAALERIAPVLWLETLPFVKPPLDIATSLAQQIAAATGTDATPLEIAFEAAVDGLRQQLKNHHKPLLILKFLEDGRHALAFTEGSMPGDLLARAGGVNALESKGPPGVQTLGLSEILALNVQILSLGPLPESAVMRRVSAGTGFRARALPAVFPAGGLTSARRFCEALSAGLTAL